MTGVTGTDVASLGKVAVLMGGLSAEREVSLMSGQGVLDALLRQGVDAYAFDPAQRPMSALRGEGFARCFIALHGRYGEDGAVQGALELMGIPYTGSGVMASAICMDKVMTKRLWRADGLPTPDWRLVASAQEAAAAFAALGAPMIVKPAREGSTIGLTKVERADQVAQAYALAATYDPEVLCETFIQGVELTCPVLGEGATAHALPVIRIEAPQGNYDYNNKYFTNDTQYHCPSGLSTDVERHIQALCVAAFQSLGCRGWARVDVLLRARDGAPQLLEINTSPGMTSHSLVPMSARVHGLSYEALCVQLLQATALDNAIDLSGMTPKVPGEVAPA
ncbi:D-alanine--D-alanine ligase [Comamonas serinivorans]|uniref:D-alanine--D-alanine ligase n=1 Tax=Comamonas serinivorans TaxID=1082851 RepID=A0A1Y0ESH2_9BURK|nr:D-alanine--D-alanine ligase [Comamonas serinivorans]ARU06239.1 D-alanine--D-alanine ligase [Comamonas serinivorans]